MIVAPFHKVESSILPSLLPVASICLTTVLPPSNCALLDADVATKNVRSFFSGLPPLTRFLESRFFGLDAYIVLFSQGSRP
jgi:hypothetical protein